MVADAGMLSAANLLALEEAGFEFIVGSRISKAPYDLAEQFDKRGTTSPTGRPSRPRVRWGSARTSGTGGWCTSGRSSGTSTTTGRSTRWSNAEKVADGTRPLKKDRFVKFTDTATEVDWTLVERARYLAGLKGYVTNIPEATMTGGQVVAAHHDLYQVERSFRMAKSDLAARPDVPPAA